MRSSHATSMAAASGDARAQLFVYRFVIVIASGDASSHEVTANMSRRSNACESHRPFFSLSHFPSPLSCDTSGARPDAEWLETR